MAHATTTTAPELYVALTDAIAAELPGVQVAPSWLGPDTNSEQVIFGSVEWDRYEDAAMKQGRRTRQETYRLQLFVRVFYGDGTPQNVTEVRDRAFVLLAGVENVLANDVKVGQAERIQGAFLMPVRSTDVEFEAGWAVQLEAQIRVEARLV